MDSNLEVKTIDPDYIYVEYDDAMFSFPPEDKYGLRVTSGVVNLNKSHQNLIGISIGGGVPYCPCIYIVQIFDNSIAALDGNLEAGDEITAINNKSVRGLTRTDVSKLIKNSSTNVKICFNKLHIDERPEKTVDIVLKQIKHRIIENISSNTADFLGISRAVLVNDGLIKRLEDMQKCAKTFYDLAMLICKLNKANKSLSEIHEKMAEIFDEIGIKEPQPCATEAFLAFSRGQKSMQKYLDISYKNMNKIVGDLQTFYKKVVPDTKMTVRKYLNAKFEYLAYCLKIKEMDDEESCFAAMHESLYRIETGNYEYRLLLKYRQKSRKRFAKMRTDVLEKLELLDNKHVQDMVKHLGGFMDILKSYYQQNYHVWKDTKIFPIEIDLNGLTNYDDICYKCASQLGDSDTSDNGMTNILLDDD